MEKFSLTTLFVSAAALCMAACGVASSPEATAERFYAAVARGDCSRALEYTDVGDEDTELYCALMEKVHISVAEKGGIEKMEVSELRDSRDSDDEPRHTVVRVRIDYADGSSQEEYCDMVLVDGKWRVDVDLDSK